MRNAATAVSEVKWDYFVMVAIVIMPVLHGRTCLINDLHFSLFNAVVILSNALHRKEL